MRRTIGRTIDRLSICGAASSSQREPDGTRSRRLARQLIAALPSGGVTAEDIAVSWNALLRYATQQTKERKRAAGRFALILDEFPNLVDQTPELPSILQAWWDREAVHSPLLIVLCGSQLSPWPLSGKRVLRCSGDSMPEFFTSTRFTTKTWQPSMQVAPVTQDVLNGHPDFV